MRGKENEDGVARAVRARAGGALAFPRHGQTCSGHPDKERTARLSEMPGTTPGMTKEKT
jgi:hypothetical protein